MGSPNKTTALLNRSPCQCCTGRDHSHTPQHPDTLQREHSTCVVPGVSHTSAKFAHPDGVQVHWNSRAHRKGRLPRLRQPDGTAVSVHRPPIVLLNLDVRNISWWIGAVFTVASVVWVVNGVYSFAPLPNDATSDMITGITALIGGGLFIIGGYLAVLESLNANEDIPFNYVLVRDEQEEGEGHWEVRSRPTKEKRRDGRRFRYWGWEPRSLGYMSNLLVFIGALIFYIPCITGYPTVFNSLSPTAQNIAYWLPQVMASVLFVFSPALSMLEIQTKWFEPRPFNLDWEAAFWNLVGGLGFLLCGALGFASANPVIMEWGVALSTLWGSVAFLIGSMFQWFECMNPHELEFEVNDK